VCTWRPLKYQQSCSVSLNEACHRSRAEDEVVLCEVTWFFVLRRYSDCAFNN
jgi:hypothetical protein